MLYYLNMGGLMGQDKHQPKDNKKKFTFSNDAEKTLIGIMIFLISIIGLLNRGYVGEFLTYIMVYIFGVFYFIFFIGLAAFGLTYAIKRKGFSIKVNLYLLGGILLIFSLMIAASISMENLELTNVFTTYNHRISYISSSLFNISDLTKLGYTGGGFIGTFFTALFNTAFTSLGTHIVAIILFTSSIIILMKNPLQRLFSWSKKRKEEKRNRKSLDLEKLNEENINDNEIEVPLIKNPIEQDEKSLENYPSEYKASPFKTSSFDPKKTFNTSPNVNSSSPYSNQILQVPLVEKEEIKNDEPEEKSPINLSAHNDNPFIADEINYTDKTNIKIEEKYSNVPDVEKEEAKEKYNEPEDSYVRPSPFKTSYYKNNTQINFVSKEQPTIKKVPNPAPFEDTYKQPEVIEEEVNNEYTIPGYEDRIKPALPPSNERKYILPGVDMLSLRQDDSKNEINQTASLERAKQINQVFDNFKIHASVISYNIGPSVTRFNVRTDPGVRVNSIASLTNEIQVALCGDKSVRIETVVQGKDTSGIEVGNKETTTVNFRDCFASLNNQNADKLVIPLGQDISKNVISISIDTFPHLLVAGTTGSGKSVFIHSIIMTLIMRNYPDELRLILIDPKRVEFAKYSNIPHLYCPIITDVIKAGPCLAKLCNEMDRRFQIMEREAVVNIKEYRQAIKDKKDKEVLPNIVVIVDEYADLAQRNQKEIEPLIQRIAQKARACGIYLIIATQRPSVNVITGDIKANIPSRIALSVSTSFDSKTILDETGAETLLGKGDLLARIPTSKSLIRVQSAFVDNDEITRVTNYLRQQQKPVFNQEFLNLKAEPDENSLNDGSGNYSMEQTHEKNRADPLYPKVRDMVLSSGVASSSYLMRMFHLGYGKAASFLDTLEADGYIKTISGGRKQVIKQQDDFEE